MLILRCPFLAGPPLGDPNQVLTLLLPLHSVTDIIHITILSHTHSFLLPAHYFSCTFLISRSMIAQVLKILVVPLVKHMIPGKSVTPKFRKAYNTHEISTFCLTVTHAFAKLTDGIC